MYFNKINHGDLHQGNIKCIDNKLILFDFGYCWQNNNNNNNNDILDNINEASILYLYDNIKNLKKLKYENFIEFIKINNMYDKLKDKYIEKNDFIEYIRYCISLFYENNIEINIYIINILLSVIHIYKYTNNHCKMIDNYNFCKTYKIFDRYREKLISDIKKYKLIEVKENYLDNYDLKKFL